MVAARNLLGAALREPLNQKFILLSESGLPLYPPTTTYLQLMQEDKSRLDSCGMGVSSGRSCPALSTHRTSVGCLSCSQCQ